VHPLLGPTRNYLKSLIDQAGSTTLFGAELVFFKANFAEQAK
jgi:hypothetical protein